MRTRLLELLSRFKIREEFRLPLAFVAFIGVAVLVGGFLLWLPVASSAEGFISPITALFTAVSALTDTGLIVTNSGAAWTLFGQIVIMLLIFIGGLGIMTGGAFVLILAGQRFNIQGRLLIREDVGGNLSRVLPTVRNLVILTIAIQLVGGVLLWVDFYLMSPLWTDISLGDSIWMATFHTVSAFNNSGFEIFPDSLVGGDGLVGLRARYASLSFISVLTIAGAIGYPIISGLWLTRLRLTRLSLDSKLALIGFIALLILGLLAFFIGEWSNPATVGQDSWGTRVASAFFEATTSRTAGSTVINQADASGLTKLALLPLMLIGGVAGSTAGGIKVVTFMVVVLGIFAAVRGDSNIKVFKRTIYNEDWKRAVTVLLLALGLLAVIPGVMLIVQPELDLFDTIFEATSALATVGLSQGITGSLNEVNQLIVTVTMLVGRYGILILALTYLHRRSRDPYRYAQEHVRIG